MFFAKAHNPLTNTTKQTRQTGGSGTGANWSATRNLHVCNFSETTTEDDIKDLFTPHCEVVDVHVKDDYAFVNTASIEAATAAKQALRGAVLDGFELKVVLLLPRLQIGLGSRGAHGLLRGGLHRSTLPRTDP